VKRRKYTPSEARDVFDRAAAAVPMRYKGYWIKFNAMRNEYWIEIDGAFIGYAQTITEAKRKIDEIAGPQSNPRKRTRKRNSESFRQTGGIHIDIGSDIKGRGAIRNPIKSGYSKATVSANIEKLMREGRKQKQAIAIAIHSARQSYRKKYPRGAYPHWLAKMNPARATRKSSGTDAYAMIRNALKTAHAARGAQMKQAAVSYCEGVICASRSLGAISAAEEKLYANALLEIATGKAK
jgi:hypothetical protein